MARDTWRARFFWAAWASLVLALLPVPGTEAVQRGVVIIEDRVGNTVAQYRESHALVIGVSGYTNGWPPLRGVKDDLPAVKKALERKGFQVQVVKDPDQAKLESTYRDFILRHGRKQNNRLVFYFAGHGYTEKPSYATDDPQDWMGYIVSRDAPLPDLDFPGFRRNAMSMQRFEELAKDIQSKHALFVFDSCFSGSVFSMTRAVPRNISRKTAKPVRQFITSGSADQEVPDVSEFRRQFITALEGEGDLTRDGYVTGTELGLFLEERVTDYTEGAQTPQYGKLRNRLLDKGDFVFAVNAPVIEAPVADPAIYEDTRPSKPAERVARLTVRSNVRGDTLYIDGQAQGPTGPKAHELKPGTYTVRVEKSGYQPWERKVSLAAGEQETLRAVLARKSRPKLPVTDPGIYDNSKLMPRRAGDTWTEPLTGMEFVWVPPGCFRMGSGERSRDTQPVHRVCVKGFWLGKHEVTQGQWQQATGNRLPHFRKGADYPIETATWNAARVFIRKLNMKGPGGFRLPSEAEWEYACRSGGRTETYCGGEDVDSLGWHWKNSGDRLHPIGTKQANGLGLYDMSGSVWEWVQDCWHSHYDGAPSDGSAWEEPGCRNRVLRGGSIYDGRDSLRSTYRSFEEPDYRDNNLGFRLARDL